MGNVIKLTIFEHNIFNRRGLRRRRKEPQRLLFQDFFANLCEKLCGSLRLNNN